MYTEGLNTRNGLNIRNALVGYVHRHPGCSARVSLGHAHPRRARGRPSVGLYAQMLPNSSMGRQHIGVARVCLGHVHCLMGKRACVLWGRFKTAKNVSCIKTFAVYR